MLSSEIITALNAYIDSVIQNLPNRKEEFIAEIDAARQAGFTDVSIFNLHMNIISAIVRDISRESRKIFAKVSGSDYMDELIYGEMSKLIFSRRPEIGSAINALQWI